MFDDFDVQIQSDEIDPKEYEEWLKMFEETDEELQADLEAQDRWYHETFEDVAWSDFD
jgi:hypothetical protein